MPPFSRDGTRLPPGSSVNSLNSRLFGNKTRPSTSPKGGQDRLEAAFYPPYTSPPLYKIVKF